jgi:hypothetical protein
MEKVLPASNSAYATLFTVEHLLIWAFIIVKGTNLAEILGKVFTALNASFTLFLLSWASETFNHGHFVSVKSMVFLGVHLIFIMDLIVTETTCIEGSLTERVWTLELTCSQVVLATYITRLQDIICI